jgi:hypothetical protein
VKQVCSALNSASSVSNAKQSIQRKFSLFLPIFKTKLEANNLNWPRPSIFIRSFYTALIRDGVECHNPKSRHPSHSYLKVALACSNNIHKMWRVKFTVKRLVGLVAVTGRQMFAELFVRKHHGKLQLL